MGDDTPAGGAVGRLSRPAPFLPPAVQPGHQPADRSAARIAGDEPQDPLRQSRQRLRRGPEPDARSCSWRRRSADDRRLPARSSLFRREGEDHRLHLRRRRRAERAARGAGAAARRRPRRRCASGYEQLDPDRRGGRRGAAPMPMILATGAVHSHLVRAGAADLQLDHGALGRMPRCALCRRPDRGRRHRGQPLSGRGGDRRPPRPRPVPRPDPRRVPGALQGGDRPGPAQDHVQDGHLDHQLLPRRLQFRGGRAVALALRRVLPGAESRRISGIGLDRHQEQDPARCTQRAYDEAEPRARRSVASIATARRRAARLRGPDGPSAAAGGRLQFLCRLPALRRDDGAPGPGLDP